MMSDLKSLEHPTLKVPYEILNKKFRSAQKVLDREVSHVTGSLTELDRLLSDGGQLDRVGLAQQLDNIKEQLVQLKSKGGESVGEEQKVAEICHKRAEHLKEGCIGMEESTDPGPATVQQKMWRKIRLDRMLVEYLLRQGFYNTAIQLAQSEGLQDLTNIEVFLTAREVEQSLAMGDVSKCLNWCHENKSKLRKMKSTLEFNVRLQEFIELVKTGNKLEAVRHAKRHLATSEDCGHLEIVQQAMGLLAFPLDTVLQPYKDLLDTARWQSLIEQFRGENYRLHQLSSQSMFTVALQAGLASLKTPHCYKQTHFVISGLPGIMQELRPRAGPERNPECPVCQPALNTLAINLPYAHCSQSRLVCNISGRSLNENNQPMMLPNGYVYGEQALVEQATQNEGQVICPRTKEIYSLKDAEKVYVM